MFRTDAILELVKGLKNGHISLSEYYEMANLLN